MKYFRFILIIFLIFPVIVNAHEMDESNKKTNLLSVKSYLLSELKTEKDDDNSEEESRKNLAIASSTIGIIIFISSIVMINKRKNKEKNNYIKEKYLREIPDNLNPYIVGYLLDGKTLKRHTSATILDLINRNIITCTQAQNNSIILNKNVTDYSKISRTEEKLLDFIFDDKYACNLDELKSRKNADFKYLAYKNEVRNEMSSYNFICNERKNKISNLIFILIGIIAILFLLIFIFNYNVIYIFIILALIINVITLKIRKKWGLIVSSLCILSILFISYCYINMFYNNENLFTYIGLLVIIPLSIIPIFIQLYKEKYTENGKLEFYKWESFKEYLKQLSNTNDKFILENNRWQRYLTYSITLGCFNEIIKAVNMNTDEYISLLLKVSTIVNNIEDIIDHNENMIKNEMTKVK